jgi:hypothetical protein
MEDGRNRLWSYLSAGMNILLGAVLALRTFEQIGFAHGVETGIQPAGGKFKLSLAARLNGLTTNDADDTDGKLVKIIR